MKKILIIVSIMIISMNLFAQKTALIGESFNTIWNYQFNETGVRTPKVDTLSDGNLVILYVKTVKSNPETASYSYYFDQNKMCNSLVISFKGNFEKSGFRNFFNKEHQYNGNNVWLDFKSNLQITVDLNMQEFGVYFFHYYKIEEKYSKD